MSGCLTNTIGVPIAHQSSRFSNAYNTTEPETITVHDPQQRDALLDVLDDSICRTILATIGRQSLSAKEVSDACDIALSTTYRKLDELTESGLLLEGTRIRRSGKHMSEYSRIVDDVYVSVGSGNGIDIRVKIRPLDTIDTASKFRRQYQ